MKQLAIFLACAVVLTLGVGLVIGAPEGANTISEGASGQYTVTPTAQTTEGGNVTNLNITSNQGTSKWNGFYGNISGSLRLGDGANVFYDWTSVTFQAVYASPGNVIDWASVGDINSTSARTKANKDTDYGFTTADADSIASTLSGDACSAGTIFSFADGVSPYNSTGSASAWETCVGEDSTDQSVTGSVFGTDIIESGSDAYDGSVVQYQVMVPVNATGQNYYFYLEI